MQKCIANGYQNTTKSCQWIARSVQNIAKTYKDRAKTYQYTKKYIKK